MEAVIIEVCNTVVVSGGRKVLEIGGDTDDGACISMHTLGGLGACSPENF